MWGASVRALQSTAAAAKSKKAKPEESEDAEQLTRDAASRVRDTELESTVSGCLQIQPCVSAELDLAASFSESTACRLMGIARPWQMF